MRKQKEKRDDRISHRETSAHRDDEKVSWTSLSNNRQTRIFDQVFMNGDKSNR